MRCISTEALAIEINLRAIEDEVESEEARRMGMSIGELREFLEDLQEEGGQLTSAEVAALHEPEPAWKKPLFERR